MANNILLFLRNLYPYLNKINVVLGLILTYAVFYHKIYTILGIFFTRKFKPAKNNHKYAIVISARNEENVIGNLLDSIKKQDYPNKLLTVFVVADNCTDNTAQICRKKGAIVYERFDDAHRTKGYALEYLFNRIEEDYKRDSFEGYFVFDADNLLKKDYISRMNDAFDSGEKIITSYRNTKNFDETWVASTYAIHWLRSIRFYHRARSFLHLATNIQGTGFLFANEVVKDGWHYTSLTEDRALTVDAVSQGYQISYQDKAEFYDEQPTSIKIALRQRVRWSKGHLLAFEETGFKLFRNIIFGEKFVKVKWSNKKRKDVWWKRVLISLKNRFMMFDTFMQILPTSVINLVRWLIVTIIFKALYYYPMGINNINPFSSGNIIAKFINLFVNVRIDLTPGASTIISIMLLGIWLRLFYRLCAYITNIWVYYYVIFIERKRIKHMPISKIILYSFTWPLFDVIGRYTTYIALFKKVEWKPIPHDSKITIDDINKNK